MYRNWLKAFHMLDKYDPRIIATVSSDILIFRKSELEKYKEKYGENLKILF